MYREGRMKCITKEKYEDDFVDNLKLFSSATHSRFIENNLTQKKSTSTNTAESSSSN